jgi:hypothetical protein
MPLSRRHYAHDCKLGGRGDVMLPIALHLLPLPPPTAISPKADIYWSNLVLYNYFLLLTDGR